MSDLFRALGDANAPELRLAISSIADRREQRRRTHELVEKSKAVRLRVADVYFWALVVVVFLLLAIAAYTEEPPLGLAAVTKALEAPAPAPGLQLGVDDQAIQVLLENQAALELRVGPVPDVWRAEPARGALPL